MSNKFDVGDLLYTTYKYVDIVCDVLCNKDKLFDKYLKTPTKDCLLHIRQQFEDLIGLPTSCGAIDGTHVPVAKRLNRRYIIAATNYCNQKRFLNIFYKQYVIHKSCSRTFVLVNQEEFMKGVNSKPLICIMTYEFDRFYKS
jgi:hypothetical protein